VWIDLSLPLRTPNGIFSLSSTDDDLFSVYLRL